ncbi:MAG: RluA family pseudouridine synthase [Cytophagales bacterium]|uniref:RluA family pseudouridine synthase n=1 Tax=Cyclobacterium marinum TaxID=104 RepID=UPI0011EFB32C|nr:RluA family pseudouridine synthase [Cyclobacterium marinum]MBI0400881.1 RluA family pseudouridine synthase [Cyclobacterium marinum]MBR9774418.1 RluA family pseudouridine synthase [Cytophagales bacterium]|tara:strand:+ start:28973 stop:30007 length:1035 start_codon:yes stop_codon:yes gene_type:complete
MTEITNEELPEEESFFDHHELTVDPGQSSIRIDKFITDKLAYATRNKVQQSITSGIVQVNGEVVKANYKIKAGDLITFAMEKSRKETEVVAEDLPLDIRYEDDHLMVVYKPAGMVVHPAHGNWTGTLVNALAYYFKNLPELPGNSGRPGLVHRIDKDTSGLLVIAKSERAMTHLAKQFFDHSISRSYVALVWGEPSDEEGTINVPIGRGVKDRKVMQAYPEGDAGKSAITHWKVIKRLRYVTLLSCELETGRTHQIRAHMKYIGHPLFNDAMYGGDQIRKGTQYSKYKSYIQNCFQILPRQALHAKSLGFIHPISGEELYFEGEIPEDMLTVIEKWENYVKFEK